MNLVTSDIQLATTAESITPCFKVMQQLRPHLKDEKAFVQQVLRQIEQGYHLAYTLQNDRVASLAGYRFLEFTAWGKVLYLDDLITDEACRANGHASKLLKHLLDLAKERGCSQVHLDSGPQRHDAHRLYLNHGFKIIGYHFALDFN